MLELKQITVLPTLMRWRIEVLRSLSGREPHPRLLVVTRQYFREHIADGSHVAFVAEVNGVECGCGSICLADELPTPDNPTGRYASLVNIYVCEPYRNQGLECCIVRRLMEEAGKLGCGKIYLETADKGLLQCQ